MPTAAREYTEFDGQLHYPVGQHVTGQLINDFGENTSAHRKGSNPETGAPDELLNSPCRLTAGLFCNRDFFGIRRAF